MFKLEVTLKERTLWPDLSGSRVFTSHIPCVLNVNRDVYKDVFLGSLKLP